MTVARSLVLHGGRTQSSELFAGDATTDGCLSMGVCDAIMDCLPRMRRLAMTAGSSTGGGGGSVPGGSLELRAADSMVFAVGAVGGSLVGLASWAADSALVGLGADLIRRRRFGGTT